MSEPTIRVFVWTSLELVYVEPDADIPEGDSSPTIEIPLSAYQRYWRAKEEFIEASKAIANLDGRDAYVGS